LDLWNLPVLKGASSLVLDPCGFISFGQIANDPSRAHRVIAADRLNALIASSTFYKPDQERCSITTNPFEPSQIPIRARRSA